MSRWIAMPGLAGFLLCLALGARLALAQAPVGITELRIESDTVATALGARRAALESSVAKLIAEQAERYFGFVGWAPGKAVSGTGLALIVRLAEQPTPNCTPAITLRLDGSLGTPVAVSNAIGLYDGCDPAPAYLFADLAQFESDLQAAIAKIFDEPVRRTVLGSLLAKVSLTNTLNLDHAQKQLMLPLKLQDLKASEESQLTVQFDAGGTRGRLRLNPFGPSPGGILCQVSDYVVPPPLNITGPSEHFFWHETFDRVFPADHMPRLGVYMTRYVPDPFAGLGVTDGLVTTGP